MTFIRTFLRRYESHVETSYRTVNTIEAVIRREGSRMVDNAEITLSGKNDVRIKDYLGYIQDNIDLGSLMGLWNFAGAVRDESGNELHEENAYNNFVVKDGLDYYAQTSSSKVYGKRSMKWSSQTVGRYLKIPDKKVKNANGTDSVYSTLDMSLDFTLSFFVRLDALNPISPAVADTNSVLFDKYDDSTNKGIMIYTQTPSGSPKTVRNLKIRIGNGTTNTVYTHTMTSTDWNGLDKHICVTRTGGVLKVYLENTEVISQTFTGDITSTADIYLGKEYSESASALVEPTTTGRNGGMPCTYHQMRIYNRSWSISEIKTWVGQNAPSITLKFYGRVWRIDERSASNKCYLKGLGSVALQTRIDSTLLLSSVSNLRDLNVYQTGTKFSDIIQDMLKNVNDTFFGTSNSDLMMVNYQERQNPVGRGYTLKAPFIAEGSFLDILNDLSVLNENTFTFMPTGILQIEETNSILLRGGLILSNNNCKISDGGIDDSNLCNHLFVSARLETFESEQTRNKFASVGWWYTLFMPTGLNTDVSPIQIISVERDGVAIPVTTILPTAGTPPTVNSYYIDRSTVTSARIYFYDATGTGSPNSDYTWKYTYNLNCANIEGAKSRSATKIETDTSSVTKNGLYARKLSVPRITPNLSSASFDQDINEFATNFVDANKGDSNDNIQSRYEVKTPHFIDHILENSKVQIYYIAKNIGSVVSGDIVPAELQIKSIEYRYPNSLTKLEVGEFLYDSFDLEKASSEGLRSVQSNQF